MNNSKHKYLNTYCKHRDTIIKQLMDIYQVNRDKVKNLFLRLLYGGCFNSWARENNIKIPEDHFLKNFKDDINKICLTISSSNEDIKKCITKDKNINGSVCSLYVQEIENRILETIYNYCCDNGYIKNNNCILIFDGFMIRKKKNLNLNY